MQEKKRGVSDLHKKVLRNMENEAGSMEQDIEQLKVPAIQKKEKGFVAKIRGIFWKK